MSNEEIVSKAIAILGPETYAQPAYGRGGIYGMVFYERQTTIWWVCDMYACESLMDRAGQKASPYSRWCADTSMSGGNSAEHAASLEGWTTHREFVLLEEMPAQHRASHRAAGNWGRYPGNGAVRRWCARDEAQLAIAGDPDKYAKIVE